MRIFGCRAAVLWFIAAAAAPQDYTAGPEVDRALARISPDSLRGNLSFLASRLLEGRDTPSRGLDLAAEYIAAQFRKARLEPAGDDGYFQTAHMERVILPAGGCDLRVSARQRVRVVPKYEAVVLSRGALEISGAPVYKVREPSAEQVTGKVVMIEGGQAATRAAAALKPAAFLEAADERVLWPAPRMIEPAEEEACYGGVPRVVVHDEEALDMLKKAKTGATGLTVSLKLAASTLQAAVARNVVGLLRGSDPALRNQYLLVTAHYDHLGASGEQVFPGANDDGSGTVSVIEIAQALAGLPEHPRRSVIFMTLFGEEEGSLGAHYYTRHPAAPLKQTVADLNLEQLGRTDSSAGPEVGNASLTGFEYSTIPRTLKEAGERTGVKVYETANGDDYFARSDNHAFAERGIPAHTIVVAFEFPDYHAAGDVWEKIDYDNMARVDRMIALATIMLADSEAPPRWNLENDTALRYSESK